MRQNDRGSVLRLLILLICLVPLTSLLAQETPVEVTTEVPMVVTSEVTTDIAADTPTDMPVVPSDVAVEIPTDTPTLEVPTEAPTVEIPVETATDIVATEEPITIITDVPVDVVTDVPTMTHEVFPPEPALTLILRDLFEGGILPAHWLMPPGWSLAPTADGHAIQISAASAGTNSRAILKDVYSDIAVMGYFTFAEPTGAVQLAVRESVNGAYVVTLNAAGAVTLEKHDATGVSVVLKTAAVSASENGTARAVRLSVMGDVLRVAVDNAEVIVVQDTVTLPAGQVGVGAVFAETGTLLFDNFFLWTPTEASIAIPIPATEQAATAAPTQEIIPTRDMTLEEERPPSAGPQPLVALPAPVLSLPALNGVEPTLRPLFKWSLVTGANRYRLRVATNFSCTTLVSPEFDVVVATATHTFATPLAQGEYWFCVESLNTTNGNASGFVGEKRRFVINVSLTPANGAVIFPLNGATTAPIPFTWTHVLGAAYIIQIADDSSFSGLIEEFATSVPSFNFPSRPFGTYFWRVRVNGAELPMSLARKVTISPPLPLGPIIKTPAPIPHLGFTNDTTPMLAWNVPTNWATPSVGQSLTYELQLATAATFAPASLVAPTVTGLMTPQYEWTNTILADTSGTVYFWRARARTNLGLYGAYSPTYRFTLDTSAPNPPATLTVPLNNAVSTSARPAFSWSIAPTANGYVLELSEETDFEPLSYGSPYNTTLTSFALPTSQAQSINPLYWRVRAKDAAGNIGAASAWRTLRIDYAVAPAEGFAKVLIGTAATSPIAFSWTPVVGLTGPVYNVSIYTDSTLTTLLHQSGPIAPATWTSPALAIGEYWWVLSVSDGVMGTSLARRFVVSAPLPSAPVAPFAPAAAPTNNTTPSFNWGTPALNASNILDYQLQLSTDKTFTNVAAITSYTVTTRPFTLPAPLPNSPAQAYYWRVRPRTALGLYGPFTLPMAFVLDTTVPNAPVSLTAPLDGANSVTARPAFSWAAGVGANRYRIEIATDNAFGNIVHQGTPTLPSYVSTLSMAQGTYYWRVWSLDTAGNESPIPSITRTFTVDYRTAPLANATSFSATTAKITFSWGLVINAPVGTTYTIEIDADFDGTPDPVLNRPGVTTASTIAPAMAQGDYQYRLAVSNGFGTSGWRTFIVSPLLPGAPVGPFAPVTGSWTNDTTPTLQWNVPTVNPGSVTGYVVDVSTVANFTAPIAGSPFDAGMNTNLTLPTQPDTPGQAYYWRVRPKAQFGLFGPYNAALSPLSFKLDTTRPADVTTLTAPLDNAALAAARPGFSWGAAAGANRYKIQIDTDNAFADPILIDTTSTLPSYAIPVATPYLQQGTYYWRVWGLDAAGNLSATSSPVRTLVISYPLAPADNTVFTSAAPNHVAFKWAAIPGTVANTIRIQIDNNSNFSSPERTSPLLSVTAISYATSLAGSSPNVNPLPHGKYYWRLLVTGHANPSQVRSFTISPAAPAAPVLSTVTPAQNTTDTTPNFGWNVVISAAGATVTGYEFQLSTVNTFATLVGDASVIVNGGGTTSLTWSPALPDANGQLYYARVRALTNLGAVGAWSGIRTFSLDTQAPVNGPNLIAPADNAAVTTPKPTFQWEAVGGATQYDIRYGTQSNLSGIVPTRVTTLTHIPAANLLLTTYYWEVRAIDAAGNIGPWSTQRILTIHSAPGAAPTLWHYTTSMPTFTWTPLAWAASYDVQVSTSPTFSSIVWEMSGVPANSAPSVTVSVPLPDGIYYWRVKGKLPAVVSGPRNEPFSAAYVVTVDVP